MITKDSPKGARQPWRLTIHGLEVRETAAAMGPQLVQGADAEWRRRFAFYSRINAERGSIDATKMEHNLGQRRFSGLPERKRARPGIRKPPRMPRERDGKPAVAVRWPTAACIAAVWLGRRRRWAGRPGGGVEVGHGRLG